MAVMGHAAKPRGSRAGYRALGWFFRVLGYRFVWLIARFIVMFYFFTARTAVRHSMAFYGRLFPREGRFTRWRRAWRQFSSFTTVFLDRLYLVSGRTDRFRFSHQGLEAIVEAARERRPLIFLMFHLGNWEVACHTLSGFDVALTLVLGRQQGERIESEQKEQLGRAGIRTVIVSDEKDFGAVELVRELKEGGMIAISGDRLFDSQQRSVTVDFLGRPCPVPMGPYVLSLLTGVPIVPIFGLRTGHLAYRFLAMAPRRVEPKDRADREAAMARCAQGCFDDMREVLLGHPEQWYNFFDYWEVAPPAETTQRAPKEES